MAQKLALALFALFGFANSQIALAHAGTVTLLAGPAPHRYVGLTRHDDDHHEEASEKGSEVGGGPKLGTKVVLGRPAVVLGKTQGHSQHGDQHDEGKGFVVVNYAAVKVGDRKGQEKRKDDDEPSRNYGHGLKKSDRDGHREAKSSPSKHGRDEAHSEVKVAKIVVREEPRPEVKIIKVVRDQRHEEHSEHEDPKVNVPVFGKLKYVDNDKHGEAAKAPITIVTAPLVSTARTGKHKVGVNEVVGEDNCEQCEQEDRDARRVTKASNKALFKNVDKLSTKIEGPIKDPIVVHDEKSEECESETSENKHHHGDRRETGAAHINYKKLHQDLAIGDARKNAPFVVSKVVFPSNKHISREHESESQTDGHRSKSSRKHH